MNMSDIAYKRLSNGRLVVDRREQLDDTPTEVATEVSTEVDSNNQQILNYFDMDIEFGEEDMEIDDDFIDQKVFMISDQINHTDTYSMSTDINIEAHDSTTNATVAQGTSREVKETYKGNTEGCDDLK